MKLLWSQKLIKEEISGPKLRKHYPNEVYDK